MTTLKTPFNAPSESDILRIAESYWVGGAPPSLQPPVAGDQWSPSHAFSATPPSSAISTHSAISPAPPVVVSKTAGGAGSLQKGAENHSYGAGNHSYGADSFSQGNKYRADFPVLSEKVNGNQPLVWLDNAATTQKPRAVIDRISYFYEHENSNVHRGAHELAARSEDAYENARKKTAEFIGSTSPENIIFVRGTTEGINLVAQSFTKPILNSGDEIVLTILEHHANIVPWQLIAAEKGAILRVAPVDENGEIILSEYAKLFSRKTKFVGITQVSNALGTILPIAEMIHIAHASGVPVLVDGAQSTPHIPVNVTALDADFFVFSGHKIFAPTGIGVVYGKKELLEQAQPYHGGGNMIADVTFEKTLYNPPPQKFEAGTPNVADAVGLGAAIDYINSVGIQNINATEHELISFGLTELAKIRGLHILGNARERASVLPFVLDGYSVEEVGKHLSNRGIAVRAGHHCAQPIHRFFGLEGSVRPSVAFYNTAEEIEKLVKALREL